MPRRTSYLVVEGPQDAEFIGRILRTSPGTFHYQNAKTKVDPFWHPLIPRSYPVGKPPNDFLGRVPIPLFYQNATHTVALQSADGISKIVARLEETLETPGITEPDSIGLMLDSDSTESPAKRAADLVAELKRNVRRLAGSFPEQPGAILEPTAPMLSRRGIFVLPDNSSWGTLEDLLLECGRTAYPELLSLADAHVAAALTRLVPPTTTWTCEDHQEFGMPSGPKKATIASATAILKPGRTTQVSVSDNRWIDSATLALPRLTAVADWLDKLIR